MLSTLRIENMMIYNKRTMGFWRLLLNVILFPSIHANLDGHCPPLGPVLPQPTSPSTNPSLQAAITALNHYFTSTLTPTLPETALSISIQSLHESQKLVDLHYTPPNTTSRAIDADTVYRVGSVSKVLTVLALLQAGIVMDDFVVHYLPELAGLGSADGVNDAISSVSWDDITIGALASHMSGLGLDRKKISLHKEIQFGADPDFLSMAHSPE